MHIVLVNDDGIQSVGIHALCRAARARGHRVSVCTQPSAKRGQPAYHADRPDLCKGIRHGRAGRERLGDHRHPHGLRASGSFNLIQEPVDVLIPGINDGYNAGMAVHYSGTSGPRPRLR